MRLFKVLFGGGMRRRIGDEVAVILAGQLDALVAERRLRRLDGHRVRSLGSAGDQVLLMVERRRMELIIEVRVREVEADDEADEVGE
ncbi:MAG: hypothetical protein ACRDTZ_05350 [Pseudonocardiaceae bacterium]